MVCPDCCLEKYDIKDSLNTDFVALKGLLGPVGTMFDVLELFILLTSSFLELGTFLDNLTRLSFAGVG